MGGPVRKRSSLRIEGVAMVLAQIRDTVTSEMRFALSARMESRRAQQLFVLSEEEIESMAGMIGSQGKTLAANAISVAYQRGVNGSPVEEEVWPADVLRAEVVKQVTKKLTERRVMGRHELEDDEIEAEARIAGLLVKNAADTAISDSHRLGVDRFASKDDHERPTTPSCKPPRYPGQF